MKAHGGQCGACGSPVRAGYTVCPACGAAWGRGDSFLKALAFFVVIAPMVTFIVVMGLLLAFDTLAPGLIEKLINFKPRSNPFDSPVFSISVFAIWFVIAAVYWHQRIAIAWYRRK